MGIGVGVLIRLEVDDGNVVERIFEPARGDEFELLLAIGVAGLPPVASGIFRTVPG